MSIFIVGYIRFIKMYKGFIKGNTLFRGGRLIFVNAVLSNLPLYFMFFYCLLEWVIHNIDHIHRAFFWKGTKDIHGGLCLVK